MRFKAPPGSEKRAIGPRWTVSGWVTPSLVALLCLGLLIAAYERGHGHLHKLTAVVVAPPPPELTGPQGPGGQDAVRLSRTPTAIGTEPEFLSAVFLPGRGMNLLQITAAIPGHGEVPLLMAPPDADVAQQLTGTGEDANGSLSATFGGAFLLPWAGRLTGTPASNGELQTSWNDERLRFPPRVEGSSVSTRGLFLSAASSSVQTHVLTDGQSVEAVFHAGSFAQHWPSRADVTVSAELSGQSIVLTVTLKNTGADPMPVGFGFKPYFALPQGDRDNVLLTIPSGTVLQTDRRTGLPIGTTAPTAGTPLDFNAARGTRLAGQSLDETYVRLDNGLLADNPIAEFREPALNYGLRIIPLTQNFSNFRVVAPAGKPWVSIEPATNVSHPLGREWASEPQLGLQTLAPGASVQWKLRLELFSLSHTSDNVPPL